MISHKESQQLSLYYLPLRRSELCHFLIKIRQFSNSQLKTFFKILYNYVPISLGYCVCLSAYLNIFCRRIIQIKVGFYLWLHPNCMLSLRGVCPNCMPRLREARGLSKLHASLKEYAVYTQVYLSCIYVHNLNFIFDFSNLLKKCMNRNSL